MKLPKSMRRPATLIWLPPHAGTPELSRIIDVLDRLRPQGQSDVGRAMQQVIAAVPVARIELKRPRLEDVFVQIADDGGRSAIDREGRPALVTGTRATVAP